ncbi:MAG: acyl-CoA dehydrogenase family protein [Bdellovibrionales bacterium]|nr:acyl-CoA dehydrogenase family protein [Bdellovibrionales bacterium]
MKDMIFEDSHIAFKSDFEAFVQREIQPHYAKWEIEGTVSRELWLKAGEQGFLCPSGSGSPFPDRDYRHNVIINQVLAEKGYLGVGFTLHNDVAAKLFFETANADQIHRWGPGIHSGSVILSLAITEPQGGSDIKNCQTTAVKGESYYTLNGSKKFVSNGSIHHLAIVVAKSSEKKDLGLSLFLVEPTSTGYDRSRLLKKIGCHARDLVELNFSDVLVPSENLLGKEGRGFLYLMSCFPQERLSIACSAFAMSEAVFEKTLEYVKEREVFGQALGRFQNVGDLLAELKTDIEFSRAFLNQCILQNLSGNLSQESAAMAKWSMTEMQTRVIDRCLQLHGGNGYLADSFVGKAFVDTRFMTIYGGSNEVQKRIIYKSLGL